ncbi:MAG: hypothetical protein IIZ83_02425 [Oscillospiraceae bacterium]|nr:hypothetical protein [Oscillospiraceae bacterium]
MHVYRNGDRCPCCGTVIQDKSREWLLEFSAAVYAIGFIEEDGAELPAPRPVGPRERARREPGRTAEG